MLNISCYVPLHNNAGTIAYCLDSLLQQSLKPAEIIVIDDASSDRGREIAERYPVKLIGHPVNKGLAAARNTAVGNISGEFVASIDADCVADPGWLEVLAGGLESSPRAAGAGGRLMETQASSVFDLWRAAHMCQCWEEDRKSPPFLFGSNTLFRCESLRSVGMYDEALGNNAEDVDICGKLRAAGYDLLYCPKALVYHQKKDDLYSLFDSHWNWHRLYYEREGWFRVDPASKIKENLGTANRYLEEDLNDGRHHLLYLDFLLGLYYCFRDFLYSKGERVFPSPAVFWAALVDLRLSGAFCRGNNGVFRFDRKENGYAADFLAVSLSAGEVLRTKFPNDAFLAGMYANLLESVYMIQDRELADLIGRLSLLDWTWLETGKYPLSGREMIPELKDAISAWLDIVVYKSGCAPTLIELASRGTGI